MPCHDRWCQTRARSGVGAHEPRMAVQPAKRNPVLNTRHIAATESKPQARGSGTFESCTGLSLSFLSFFLSFLLFFFFS